VYNILQKIQHSQIRIEVDPVSYYVASLQNGLNFKILGSWRDFSIKNVGLRLGLLIFGTF